VVSTHLKNISQIGNLPQIGMKIKNLGNHHPEMSLLETSEPQPKKTSRDSSVTGH